MNLHKNAKTCPNSRGLIVKRVLEECRPLGYLNQSLPVALEASNQVVGSSH